MLGTFGYLVDVVGQLAFNFKGLPGLAPSTIKESDCCRNGSLWILRLHPSDKPFNGVRGMQFGQLPDLLHFFWPAAGIARLPLLKWAPSRHGDIRCSELMRKVRPSRGSLNVMEIFYTVVVQLSTLPFCAGTIPQKIFLVDVGHFVGRPQKPFFGRLHNIVTSTEKHKG